MVNIKPELKSHLNLKTYWGEDYEVYKNYILYKDLVIRIPNKEEIIQYKSDYENLTFELSLVNFCNLRCKYCFADHEKPKVFNSKEHIKMIERIVNHFGKDKKYIFFLNGDGEILNKEKELKKVIKYCEVHKYLFVIRSNGTFKFFDNLNKIKNSLFADFSISYDGENSKDRVFKNGKQSGKIVKNHIKNILKAGKFVEVNTVINQDSENIYNIVSDLKNLGIKEMYITPQKNKIYNEQELKNIIENYKDFYIKSFNDYKDNDILGFMNFCDTKIKTCYFNSFNHYFKVDSDGNLSRCAYLFKKIKIEDFKFEDYKFEDKALECNNNCIYSNICKGNFCAGVDPNLGCQLRKLYFEFIYNIVIYYKEKFNVDFYN